MLGFRVQFLGFKGAACRAQGFKGFRVWGLGFEGGVLSLILINSAFCCRGGSKAAL